MLIDKPEFYYWDCLEMLRKAFVTGILMFFNKGSVFQLVLAEVFCLAFLSAAAWFRPFASHVANFFKVGAESALLVTLNLIVLLKIDFSKENVPGGEDFVGVLLLLANVVLPGVSLAVAILIFGFDAQQAVTQANEVKMHKRNDNMEFDENPISQEDTDESGSKSAS